MAGLFGDWGRLLRVTNPVLLARAIEAGFSSANARNAQLLRRNIVLGIRNQRREWPKLAPATIKRKRSSKILIDRGDMIGAVTTIPVTRLSTFVGIPKGKRPKRGKRRGRIRIADYAAKHEKGIVVKNAKGGVRFIRRPFIEPAFNESLKDMVDNYDEAGRDVIRGLLR